MAKILIADDESKLRRLVCDFLRRSGHTPVEASTGREVLDIFNSDEKIDLYLLDIMIPEVDGWEICRQIRKTSSVPIILLTARSAEYDQIMGFDAGADDYVTKPFSTSELMARVDVLYRRVEMSAGLADNSHANVITSGEFELNMRNRTLTKNGVPIELTQVEFQIMEYFFTNQDAALSRTDILEKVWGSDYFGEEKIVDVNIRRLRMKVEDDPSAPKHLLTMWGVGYKWIA